jgi:predicted phage-related endonuclease
MPLRSTRTDKVYCIVDVYNTTIVRKEISSQISEVIHMSYVNNEYVDLLTLEEFKTETLAVQKLYDEKIAEYQKQLKDLEKTFSVETKQQYFNTKVVCENEIYLLEEKKQVVRCLLQ